MNTKNCADTYAPGVLSPTLKLAITAQVKTALQEDIGTGDLSADTMPDKEINSIVVSHTAGILAGVFWFNEVFAQIDTAVSVQWNLNDGDPIDPEQILCSIRGKGCSILTGERSALNFLQTLSATATAANHLVKQAKGPVKILDTRKTIPGLRSAQKYAVVCGRACNHRQGLFDGILLKENHIQLCGSIETAVHNTRHAHPDIPIAVEVEDLQQVHAALSIKAEIILLDNFSLDNIREAVKLIGKKAEIEVSGGVNTENIAAISETGVQRISVGAITKNVQALDLSMRFINIQS